MTDKPLVIDVHAHLGRSMSIRKAEIGGVVETTAEDLINTMKDAEVDKAIICPIPGHPRPKGLQDTMVQNNLVAEAVKNYPNKFPCGLGTLEPRDGPACLDEADRVMGELGLRGLGFHHLFQGIYLDHPMMFEIMKRMSAYDDPILLVHVKEGSLLESPWRVARIARAFPDMKIIAAHPAIDVQDLASTIDVCLSHENVYMDTCIWHHHLSPMETAVDTVGAERILFGSDLPYYKGVSPDLELVRNARISDEAKQLILSGNAIKLFDLEI